VQLFLNRTGRIFAALLLLLVARGEADTGGTNIVNVASATFNDASGHRYSAISNTIVTTVAKLSAILVTPKEIQPNAATDAVPVASDATRTFVIANTSNISDAYRITALTAGALTVKSIAFLGSSGPLPVVIGSTLSPDIPPGGSVSVLVTLGTTAMHIGDRIPVQITAQTSVTGTENGLQSDTGEQWVVGGSSANLTGPGGSGTPIDKLVDRVRATSTQPGAVVTYDIMVSNSGGAPADNVTVVDSLPTGVTPILSSVTLNGTPAGSEASVRGATLTVVVPSLAPAASLDLRFDATIASQLSLGTSYVNVATVSANGISASTTLPASVLLGSSNVVYNGFMGQSHPIANASVSLLSSSGALVPLNGSPSSASVARSEAGAASASTQTFTSDPDITGPTGSYGFDLLPSQIAPGGSTFYLTIAASGFLNRRLQLQIVPTTNNALYNVTTTALDGQPLAQAGGFTLTSSNVTLQNVFGLFGNLPLFPTVTIAVTKTASLQAVTPGDRLDFSVGFQNQTTLPALQARVLDTLPPGLVYAPGTARLNGAVDEPTVAGKTLTWNLGTLSPNQSGSITYSTIVLPSDTPGSQLLNNVVVGGTVNGSSANGSANATVTVLAGAFGYRRVITGRVFLDLMHTGHFESGDRGVPGVRIFLEDGSYVTTDRNGMYDFPSVRPGPHVLRIDPTTVPHGIDLHVRARLNSSRSLQRLVHGVFDESTMQDINFALEPTS